MQPADEPLLDPGVGPQIVLLPVHRHVRPRPKRTVVMIVVLGKVIGQHFAVQAPDRVQVAGAESPPVVFGDVLAGDRAVIVGQHRLVLIRNLQRPVVHLRELERTGRGVARVRRPLEPKLPRDRRVWGGRDDGEQLSGAAAMAPSAATRGTTGRPSVMRRPSPPIPKPPTARRRASADQRTPAEPASIPVRGARCLRRHGW